MYMNSSAFTLTDMVHMAAKMTFITEALTFVHYTWKQSDPRELAINAVYDFLILLGVTFAVTFRRYG